MFINRVKLAPRFVSQLLFAVLLTLLAFGVAGMSFLGVSLALQGWATSPTTQIHPPTQR